MNKRRPYGFSGVGLPSLVCIFALLCLTVFALLSVSTAAGAKKLSLRAAQAVENYYAADLAAEDILARLRVGQMPDGVERQGSLYTYICPISDTQQLEVAAEIRGDTCTVLRWQAVSTVQWQADTSIEVWDGESEE